MSGTMDPAAPGDAPGGDLPGYWSTDHKGERFWAIGAEAPGPAMDAVDIGARATPDPAGEGLGTGSGGGIGAGQGTGMGDAAPAASGPAPGPAESYEASVARRQAEAAVNRAAVRRTARERQRQAQDAPPPPAGPLGAPLEPAERSTARDDYAERQMASLEAQMPPPAVTTAAVAPQAATEPAGTGPAADPEQAAVAARIRPGRGTPAAQGTARAVVRAASEVAVAVPRGVLGAFASAFEAADDLADWLTGAAPSGSPTLAAEPGRAIGGAIRGFQPGRNPETTAGRVTEEIAQFVTGFMRGGALLRSRGVLQGTSQGAQAGRAAAAGAIADFFYQEADEANLAAAWKKAGLPGNALTDFLATDADDSAALNRLRNAVAGVVVGAALDGAIALARAGRAGAVARRQAAAAGAPPPRAADPAATLPDAAGIPARPERDMLIVGDPARPLVEVQPQGDPARKLIEAAAATSDAAMGVSATTAARGLDGAARDAVARLRSFEAPTWIRGEPLTEAEIMGRGAEADAATMPAAVRELLAAMRRGRVGPRGELSLVSFLVKNGGIRDTTGDVRAILGTVRARPGLVNNASGKALDRALEAAREAGYFDDVGTSAGREADSLAGKLATAGRDAEAVTIRDLLDAVDAEMRDGASRFGRTADAAGREMQAAADDLAEAMDAAGLTMRDTDADIALALFGRDAAEGAAPDMAAEMAGRMAGKPGTSGGLDVIENTATIRSATDVGPVFINWGRIATPDDVQAVMRDMADAHRGDVNAARRGVQSNEETAKLADMLGLTPEQLLARRLGEAFNAETALAARQIYTASGAKLLEAARMAAAPGAGTLEAAAFRRMMATHYAIQAEVLGARAEAGRALQAWAIPAAAGGRQMRMIEDLMEATGGVDASRAMASRLAILGRNLPEDELARAMGQFVDRGWGARGIEAVQQVWMNALLSSPATHLANITGNALNIPLGLVERAAAGGVGRLTGSADAALPGEAAVMLYSTITGFRDALRLAARSYGDDGAEIAAMIGRQDLPRQGAISSQALGADPGSGLGRALDFVGHQVVSAPGRAMGAEDAFFKSIIYRNELHAQALRQGMRDAPRRADGSADPAEVGRIMAEVIRNPPESVSLAAADEALYRTFNREAGPIAQRLLQLRTSDSPGWNLFMATVMPFVRTPANLFSYSLERTPLAPFVGQWRADIAAGGARRDAAVARVATGSMIMATTYQYAEQGLVVGYGPKDPAERQAWLATGRQPYSVRVGDAWVPFNRLDPYGFILGFAGDLREFMDNRDLGKREEAEVSKLIAAAAGFVGQSLGDRSTFRGIAALAEAFDSQQPSAERFLGQTASSLMVPGAVSALGQAIDPAMYDRGQGWINGRLAGLSADPGIPRRNLWGEPMMRPGVDMLGAVGAALSPIKPTREGGRPVDREMDRLDMGLKPVDANGAVTFGAGAVVGLRDLNPAALDQLRRWAGNDPMPEMRFFGGLGFADALDQMVQGRGPLGASYARSSDAGKEKAIREVATRYRQAARERLLADPRFADVAALVGARADEAGEGRGEVPVPTRAAARRSPGEAAPPPQRRPTASRQPVTIQ